MTAPTNWRDLDHDHVWHPYSRMPAAETPLPVVGAEGCEIELADGRRLIDGMASWWSVIHGYRAPQIMDAVRDQLERMPHVMFGGLTHEPAIRLCQRLGELAPRSDERVLDRVFLSDSGSVAVEVAMKMALQYQAGVGQPSRKRFLTVRGGYHGDTFAAMSVCDPDNGMHTLFRGALADQLFADLPAASADAGSEDLRSVAQLLEAHSEEIAAFIIEPIVQGAGGMRFYRAAYLTEVAALCRQHGVLLICDEIATGFGRSGTMFASEQADVVPDLLCVGKALTGGTMSLAATLTTAEVARGIDRSAAGCFMHGPTFMGNPLACAAANASLDLLAARDWQSEVAAIEAQLNVGLEPCRDVAGVSDVRVKGAIGVIQFSELARASEIQAAVVERGVWLRPFRNLLYTMPPYVISEGQLGQVIDAMVGAVTSASSSAP
jgi:adenosylmethionine---8-amino-7-oxononanoate aminotransferase